MLEQGAHEAGERCPLSGRKEGFGPAPRSENSGPSARDGTECLRREPGPERELEPRSPRDREGRAAVARALARNLFLDDEISLGQGARGIIEQVAQ